MSDRPLPRPVNVLHEDGVWYYGWLHEVRRASDGRWKGYVSYNVAVGRQHGGWRDQDEIRPEQAGAVDPIPRPRRSL
jgi:hypothetical protein